MKDLRRAVYEEQLATIKVLEELVILDKEKSYLREGYSSLFDLMTKKLKYSEGAAVRRIRASRVMSKYPEVREMLISREVSLCTLSLSATELLAGKREVLENLRGKSKREVQQVVCKKEAPRKEQVRVVRPAAPKPAQLPSPAPLKFLVEAPKQAQVEEEYRLAFTATSEVMEKVKEARELLSHIGGGKELSLAELFQRGLDAIIKESKKKTHKGLTRKASKSTVTSANSRYVSTATKREVFTRDNHCCSYKFKDGSRCQSKWQLEVDHITPHALGGTSSKDNLRVLCRNHNQLMAKEAGLLR